MADAPGEDHDMQDANALDDDEELQMALLASMAQEQPGEESHQPPAGDQDAAEAPAPSASEVAAAAEQWAQALAAAVPTPAPAPVPAPPPAPAAAGAPSGAPFISPAQLAQALQAVMAGAGQAGWMQAPPQLQPQHPHQQHAAAPAAPSRHGGDRHALTQRPTLPAPSWAKHAESWTPWAPPDAQSTAVISGTSAAQGSALQQGCSKVLGVDVSLGTAANGGAGAAAYLQLSAEGAPDSGSLVLRAESVDAAIARLPSASTTVIALQAAWARAAGLRSEAVAAASAGGSEAAAELAPVMALLMRRLAAKAGSVLAADDDDDLFYSGGRQRTAFLKSLESGGVSPALLDDMMSGACSAAEVAMWEGVLRDSFKAIAEFSFLDQSQSDAAWKRLDIVTSSGGMKRCLAALLVREAQGAAGVRGSLVQAGSILSPLLSLSTMPRWGSSLLPLSFPARKCFEQLRGYPRNRGSTELEYNSIRVGLKRMYAAAHEILRRILTMKVPADGLLRGREVVPAWLAAMAGCNAGRAEAGSYIDRVLSHRTATFYSATDGFMLGGLAVCLRFCRPFLASPQKQQGALQHLDPSYYRTQPHRMAGGSRTRSLAGTMLPPPDAAFPFLSPDRPEGQAPHFVAECFFLTQRMMHVALLPAVYRYQALAKQLKRAAGKEEEEEDDPLEGSASTLEQYLLFDSVRAQLLDPELAVDTVRLVELQARWLLGLMARGPAAARAAFAITPESVVRDMTAWLSFIIYNGASDLLGGSDVGVLVGCLTGLLKHTDLVTSPPVHLSIVQLLLAMLSPQLDYRRMAQGSSLGARRVTPAEAALVTAVLGTGAAQSELLPALMAAYAHADHVVGLDVDKDQYDKFHLRGCIDALLMELWRDPNCAASLTGVATAAPDSPAGRLFADFVGAVLNDLMYLLKDSLQRLEDIHALEVSKADAAAWALVPPAEQAEKQSFYESQQSTTRGFMRMAVSTLDMLRQLVDNAAVRAGFMQETVVARAAAAVIHFMEILVGPGCVQLAVQDPAQYHFDPDALLVAIVYLAARLSEQPAFVKAVSAVPDYDESIMGRAVATLAAKELGEYEHRRRLEGLMAAVRQLRGEGGGTAAAAEGGEGSPPDLSFQPEAEPADLEAAYVAALQQLAVGDFDSTAPRAYNRSFAAKAERQDGNTAGKMKALSKEVRGFSGRTKLPVYAASSVMVRYDTDRMDKMRALITGPEDTPYYGGAFIFDVYFPDDYPNVPPLMELETTGGGVARFNPNLYADGKVCLSLLGTWHGGDESEKWRPGSSNLFQVLLSLQGMIFISDPYFNEPAYEGMRGTAEGGSSSLKYNSEIWLNNIRYAMIDQLKRPRPGFETATLTHFRLLRWRIMKQCAAWMDQAQVLDPLFQKRLRQAVTELHGLLAAL